jgi:CRP/FNR family transcriptional regulator, dissimilatory nitrate respiration regulator
MINAINLNDIEMFKDAPDKLKENISAFMKPLNFLKGEYVFSEGDPGSGMFAVVSGFVKLVKNSSDGKEILVRLVNSGDLFGEVVLFESDSFPVTAISGDDTALAFFPKKEILGLLENSEFRVLFCAMLMRRMRYLAERVLYVSAMDVEERFFRFLSEQYGKKYSYSIDLSKKDIASAVGTIPETFSRLLMRLKQRKIIEWENSSLVIEKNFWDNKDY